MERSNLKRLISRFSFLSVLLVCSSAQGTADLHLPGTVNIPKSLSVGTGADPNALAVVDMVSTAKGVLFPRMTSTQRDAISSPPTSLLIFNTTANHYQFYDGTVWHNIAGALGTTTTPNAAAEMDIGSTTKGFLPPRMTTTQQNAISSPPEALSVYDNVLHRPAYYNGSAWLSLASLTGTETLTNKSISGSSNTFTNIPLGTAVTGTLPAASLPNPTASTLGGTESYSAVTHQWINAISTSGVPSSTQPAFSDISGTASLTTQVTGVLPVANGGCNNASLAMTAGGLLYTDGTKCVNVGAGSSGNILQSNAGSPPTWVAAGLASPMTTGGDIIYGGASGVPTRLANGSATQVLTSNGTTLAPSWQVVGATSPAYNTTSQTMPYSAAVNDYVVASGASGVITLPTAVGVKGQSIIVEHAGTSLTNVYGFNTTGGQTVCGLGTGSYGLYTAGEKVELTSDNANWRCKSHTTDTAWSASVPFINFVTYTVTSASATIAATYVQAYVFTITAGNTASVGAIYSNNGHSYTLVQALLVGDTTVIVTGAADPLASGTLTYVSGTHTGGNLAYSAFAGGPNTTTCTVAQTIASQTTLITSCPTLNTASGKLAKTAGTGDAIITYSAFTGAANTLLATTTAPVFFGAPTANAMRWKRVNGTHMRVWIQFYQATAGPVAGSGDYLFPTPGGVGIDNTVAATYTGGTAQANQDYIAANAWNWFDGFVSGTFMNNGTNSIAPNGIAAYDSTHLRIFASVAGGSGHAAMGSSNIAGTAIIGGSIQYEFPVTGFQPN